jgi:hypothetical protein
MELFRRFYYGENDVIASLAARWRLRISKVEDSENLTPILYLVPFSCY